MGKVSFTVIMTAMVSTGALSGDVHAQIFVVDQGYYDAPYIPTIDEYTLAGQPLNVPLVLDPGGSTSYIPYDLAMSGSDLFVATNRGDAPASICEWTTSGATVGAPLIAGVSPAAISVSGSDIFASIGIGIEGTGIIQEYTTSGQLVNASLITGLSGPVGMAVVGSDLYVINSVTGTVGEYTTSGQTINDSLIAGLSQPLAIAVSGSDLFITQGNGNVGEYTTSGATVNASLITGLSVAWEILQEVVDGKFFRRRLLGA